MAVRYDYSDPGLRLGHAVAETGYLVGRHLRNVSRAPGKLIGITMNPLVMMLVVGYLFKNIIIRPTAGSYQDYIMAGIAAQVGLASLGPTAIGVAMEQRSGLASRFRSLPMARVTVLVAQTIADLIVALLSLCIVSAVGLAFGWRIHGGVLPAIGAFALLAIFIYSMLWIGVLLGMVLKSAEAIESIGAIVVVLFSFLSNAFISVSRLPGWVRPIAEWNPVSAIVTACRQLWGAPSVAVGRDFPEQHASTMVLLSLVVIFVIIVPVSALVYARGTR